MNYSRLSMSVNLCICLQTAHSVLAVMAARLFCLSSGCYRLRYDCFHSPILYLSKLSIVTTPLSNTSIILLLNKKVIKFINANITRILLLLLKIITQIRCLHRVPTICWMSNSTTLWRDCWSYRSIVSQLSCPKMTRNRSNVCAVSTFSKPYGSETAGLTSMTLGT